IVEPALDRTFYGQLRPVSDNWLPDALKISGFSREQTLAFDAPRDVMTNFDAWLKKDAGKGLFFVSDNNGFDSQFINRYFHHLIGKKPFGYSSMNLGPLYKGLVKDTRQTFKHLRKTRHSHHPVDDARGNAEALLHMKEHMGLKIALG